jgi:hypothetical protein
MPSNEEKLSTITRLKEQYGDNKFHCPCKNCKELQMKKIKKEQARKHHRDYQHFKGGEPISPIGKLLNHYIFLL